MQGIVDGRRFHAGNFMGIDRRTGQYMFHDGSEVKPARTILRVPGADKWDKEALVKVGCTGEGAAPGIFLLFVDVRSQSPRV